MNISTSLSTWLNIWAIKYISKNFLKVNIMLETKLKNTYKKLIHYFSIFTIILGTTFGSLNSAYAVDIDDDTTISTTTSADYVFVTETGKTLTFDASATLSGDNGTITDTTAGNVIITSDGDADPAAGATTITFTSIDLDAGLTDGNITITDADDRTGALTVIFDGAGVAASADVISDLGNLTIQSLEDTDDEDLTVTAGGSVIIGGTGTISAAGAGDVTLNAGTVGVAEIITFTGGLTLAEAGAGKAVLNVKGEGAVTEQL